MGSLLRSLRQFRRISRATPECSRKPREVWGATLDAKKLVSRRIQVEGNRFFDWRHKELPIGAEFLISFITHFWTITGSRYWLFEANDSNAVSPWAGKFRIGRYLGEITQYYRHRKTYS